MYYLLKSQPKPEEKPSPLAKNRKLFLVLFFLFHVIFIGFNVYYFFYYVADEEGEDGEKAIDLEEIAAEAAIEE